MIARAARDDVHLLHERQKLGRARPEGFGHDAVVRDAAVERVRERARLLEDLLEHEMPVRTLFRRVGGPLRLVHGPSDRLALRVEDVDAVARDLREIALLEIDETLRHGQERGHAARDEVLADAETDHERARDPRDDDALGVFRVEHEEGVGADEAAHGQPHGLDEVVAILQMIVHEVRGDFGVGFREKLVALRDQLVLDGLVVLDDAVVNDGDAVAGQVRMRIRLGDAAVRGPARVGDAEPASQRRLRELLLELRDLADGAAQTERVVRLHHGNACRVIAAILEPAQTLDQDGHDVALGDGSYDSAHSFLFRYFAGLRGGLADGVSCAYPSCAAVPSLRCSSAATARA